MICEKCGNNLVLINNPKYTVTNETHEAHLIYVCKKCDGFKVKK